jgi:hypothetical protein
LAARPGSLARVGLDTGAWDERPGRLVVDGRAVRVDRSAVGDDTVIVALRHQGHCVFLMIRPQTAPSPARAAKALAVRDDNDASAERISAGDDLTPTDRTRVLPGAPDW